MGLMVSEVPEHLLPSPQHSAAPPRSFGLHQLTASPKDVRADCPDATHVPCSMLSYCPFLSARCFLRSLASSYRFVFISHNTISPRGELIYFPRARIIND